jgi:hypothetical protein
MNQIGLLNPQGENALGVFCINIVSSQLQDLCYGMLFTQYHTTFLYRIAPLDCGSHAAVLRKHGLRTPPRCSTALLLAIGYRFIGYLELANTTWSK